MAVTYDPPLNRGPGTRRCYKNTPCEGYFISVCFYFKIHQTVPSIVLNIRSNNLGNLEYLKQKNIKENVNAYINNYT